MSFAAAIIVLILIYIRPQEWSTLAYKIKPIHLSVLFGLIAFLNQKVYRFELKTFFRTPHDWAIVLFYGYLVYADRLPFMDTFNMIRVNVIWYFILVLGLRTVRDINRFLIAWALCIVTIAVLAIESIYLIDFNGTRYLTESVMQGRLALNLSIFANANALGHSVIMGFPLLFFSFWWKGGAKGRPIFLLLGAIPLVALYMTQSRGAALAGVGLVCVAFIFGRPIIVQGFLICCALVVAPVALSKMPRMDSSQAIARDQGVVGRLLAFQWGREAMENNPKGVGFYWFSAAFAEDNGFLKDAHSTYVLVGAEMGYRGLFLLIAMLYVCFRSTFLLKTRTPDEERCRRALFSCVVSYIVSSWMISFAHNPIFLIIIACCGAFERTQRDVREETQAARDKVQRTADLERRRSDGHVLPGNALAMDSADASALTVASKPMPDRVVGSTARAASGMTVPDELPQVFGSNWRRIGIIDLVVIYAGTAFVIRVWEYIISKYLVQ